jgi:excisionase family DNA binding protein
MSDLPTVLAAARLGVSQRQVQRLIDAGVLPATRSAGNTWLVDALFVNALVRSRAPRGRPWSPEVAWAALWLLRGLPSPWVDERTRVRLVARLSTAHPDDVVHACRRRATVRRFRVSESYLEELGEMLVRSGASAADDPLFALVEAPARIDGYCDDHLLARLVERFHLVEDAHGNATIRATSFRDASLVGLAAMPPAVVAVDLAESLEVRERSAGLRALEYMLR